MTKKCALLFSGGKDSTYAGFLAQKNGYKLECLISLVSDNKESFMFHTPSISQVKKQAEVMSLPIIIKKSKGLQEEELNDLKSAISEAIKNYKVEAVISGAVESVYQASRIQKICDELGLECYNPLWQKNQIELLKEIIKKKFEVIIVSVAAYPLSKVWLGRKIDESFVEDINKLSKKYEINPAGEGGEFESFVLDCPLFLRRLELKDKYISGSDNSWTMEISVY